MGFAEKAKTVERVIRLAENISSVVAALMLLAMMFLGAFDVVGRYILNSPITGAGESSQLLMGGMVFLAWAYTLACRAHVTVDIFFVLYPPRVQAALSFLMMFLSLVLFSLIFWQTTSIAMDDWRSGKLVNIILIPITPFKLLVSLGALFLCLECMIQMARLIPKLKRRKEE
ncbi:MAG: TRAP transporter small permease subunit [Thermodesulfobacteriota bacterium]